MSELTVANCLGLLLEDPYDRSPIDGLRELLQRPEPPTDGRDPLRLLEAARGEHERRGEFLAASWLTELECDLVSEDPEFQKVLIKELGRVRRDELMDDRGALRAYEKLGGLASEDPEVVQAVDQIQQLEDKWPEVAKRFVEEGREAVDPRLKTSLLTRAASLMWQYGGAEIADEADEIFDEALAADPSHMRTARQYALSLRARERWDDVASVFVRAAKAARTRDEKASAWLQAARVMRRSLGDAEGAARAYRQVLELAPTDPEALEALVARYTDLEAWDDLAAMYESALRSRQKLEDEKGMLLQLAMVHWKFRGAPEDAEPFFARLRKIDAAHPGVLDFYREQIGNEDSSGRLLTIVGDALRTTTDPERQLALARELGLRAQKADRPERALEAWKMVERLAPGDLDARTALQQLYQRGGKWNALSESIRGQIDGLSTDAKEEKVRLLRDLIPIYRDALHLDSMLMHVYGEILALSPSDEEALGALASLYENAGRWNELIHVLERQAELAEEPAEKVELYLRVARLWLDRFANLNQATEPLEQVVRLQPDHAEALAQLKDIYTRKRKWEALFGVLSHEAELETDPAARTEKKIEMAELCASRLHHHAAAIALWKEISAAEPSNTQALDALENLAEREKDWETSAEVLERRAELAVTEDEQRELLQRLGVVLMERLDRPAEAIAAWERVLELDPSNSRVRRMLKEAYLVVRDWSALEASHEQTEDWAGLAEALGQAAEREDEPEAAALSLRAAEVYRDRLGDLSRAARSYERALVADPGSMQAATGLLPIYERDHRWPEAVRMLEIIVAKEAPDEDPAVRLKRLGSLRSVCLHRLRNPESSLGWATRAYLLAPTDPDVVAGLEESAEAAGAHADLVELFRDRLENRSLEGAERLDLQRRIAAIAGERLGESEESIRQLEAILRVEPDDAEAMAVLDRLYRAERRFADLRRLYERRLEQASDPAERWVLLNEVAQVEEEQLGDLPSAAERHWKVLESNPHDVDALLAVERLSQQLKQWDRLDAALVRRLQSKVSDDDRLSVYLQLADLRRIHLDDAAGALECYRSALELDGRNEVAITGLEALSADDGGIGAEAIDLLEPAYAKRGHFDRLAGLLQKRLEQATSAKQKRSLQLRLADLSTSELGDARRAYEALESAFADNPTDRDLFERLGGIADAAEMHEAFAKALVTAIEGGAAGSDLEPALCRRAAEILDVVLGEPGEAARFHRRVLDHDPGDATAFSALKQLYTKYEQWDDLRGLYQRRIDATTDAGTKLDLLLQLCFLFEEILDEPKQAISSYEQALELDPTHTPSRRALQRLYARLGRWSELAELLERDLDEASGQDAVDLAYELATIHETRLERFGDAVDHYELVLQSSPTHLRAQEGLQRLMEKRDQRQRVANILQPIFESQGAWGELAKVLEVQLEDLSEPASRAAQLSRVGELSEVKLRDDELAFAAYARAVREDPADGSARADLGRLAAKLGRHPERAELLESGLDSVGDDFARTEILLELAELWDVAAPNPERAQRTYQRLIRFEHENPEIVLKASRALERLHRAGGQHEELAQDLRRQIRFEEDATRLDELYPMLAELLENTLGDPDAAIEVHQERLERDAAQTDALGALERLYEERGRWELLVETLERRAELCAEEQEQLALLVRAGEIYESKVGSVDRAIDTHRDVISRFGSHEPSLQALCRLYRRTERWQELLEVIEIRAEVASDPDERIALRFEAAELMRTRTGQAERAFSTYEQILAASPGHPTTLAALEQLAAEKDEPSLRVASANALFAQYEAAGRRVDQIRMLEVVADADEPAERVEALLRAAQISEEGMEDLHAAFVFTARALREGVDLDQLGDVLFNFDRQAQSTGLLSDQIATLDAIAPELLDAELRTEVRMQAARVAMERLGDTDFARAQYQRVLEEQPDHRPALDALLTLVENQGASRELVELLRRKGDLCDDREERAELLVRQAHLLQSELDDPDAAIEALDQALSENDHPLAYEGLERLYRRTRQWESLAALYEREIDQRVGDPAAVRYELGELCLRRLDEPERALDQFREALSQNPEHEPTVRALESLVERSELRSAAAELLEPVYLRRMQWDDVTRILEARLDGEQSPAQRIELLRHLGDVQESHLEDLDGALETYGRLFAADPHDQHNREILTRLARSLGRWDRLAAIFDKTLRAVEVDDGDTAALALATARLYDERLEELDRAGYFYQRALTYDPSNKEAGRALASVYARGERWDALLELDRERESFADADAERRAILHEIARVEVEELGSPEDAVLTFRRILEIEPTDQEAVRRLDQLLEAAERWEDLGAHLELQIDNAPDLAAGLALRQRLGTLTETKLESPERALDIFEDILADRPDYQPALQAVDRLVDDPEHGPRAVQILDPLHRQAGDWLALVRVLGAKAAQAADAFERADTWREIAELQETRGRDARRAFEAWGQAWVAEPADEATRAQVDRLAAALRCWPAYLEICEEAAAATDEPALRSSILQRVADIQDRELGDPRGAIETYRRVLEADPGAGGTLDHLEGLQVMVGDWQGLAWVYERKLELTDDGQARAELLNRLGGLFEEQLADSKRAISYYEQATGESPDDPGAYAALDRLFASANDSERLASVLERRMQIDTEPEAVVELGLRLAELYEAQLGRPDAACDALRAVAEADPDHRGALEGLSRLYERQGQWRELVEVLRRRADAAAHDSERVLLMHQLGNVVERELDDELGAIAIYGQALQIDPEHEPSLRALLRITKLDDYREDAAAVVEPHLRAQARWSDLAALLRLRADAMADPHQKAEQLVALAEVHEQGRRDPNAALDALLQSIGERPDDQEIVDRAEALAKSLQRWSDLIEVLFAEANANLDPEQGAALYRRAARICEEDLHDSSRAIEAYERVQTLLGDEPTTLEALDRLLEVTGQWERLHEVISRRLDLPDADRATLLLRLGQVRASHLGDFEGALGAYQTAMEQDPGREETLAAVQSLAAKPEVAGSALDLLDQHYRSAGELEQVVRLYDQRVELAASDADRVALLTEAATLWEQELGRPDRALSVIREAVRIDPRDRTLVDSLERLADLSDRWSDLAGLVDEIAAQRDLDRRELYELRLRSAGWARDRMSDLAQAERALNEALQLDPEPLEAYEQLVSVLGSQSRTADLVGVLRAWAEVEPSSDKRVALLQEAAERARDELSNAELAADCYRALIAVDGEDLNALRALCEIRGGQSRWNEVVGLLERQLEVAGDDQRASIARAMGETYRDRLNDPRAATAAYERALELDPADAAAMDALETLYREQDRLEALRTLLENRAQRATGGERTTLQLRLAQLYEQCFRDQQAAITMYRQVLDADPENEIARVDLERLFEAVGAWDDLVVLLSSQVGDASPEEQRRLLERVAEIHDARRGDLDEAVRVYERINAELGPDERSLRALASLYERGQSWSKTADALERLAARLDGAEAIELCHRAVDLWEQQVGDAEQASRALRSAYQRFPEDRATADRLKRDLGARGEHRALAGVLDGELQSATTDDQRLGLLRELSDVYRDRLADPATAASYLERAVALDGEDRAALIPLCDLYTAAGRQQDAVPILRRIIESFGRQRSKELALHYHRLGQALDAAGDAQGALEAYDAAFKIDLTNVAILRDLGRLTHATGDLDRAQKSFRALLLQKLEPDSGIQKADVYYYLGDIAARQDDTRKAITMLERALAEDAGHAQASELLTRLKG